MSKRIVPALLLIGLVGFQACGSFGRKVNQALPEWMRTEPGAEEKERLVHLRKRVEASPEEKAARAAAFAEAKADYDAENWSAAGDKLESFLSDFPASEFDEEGRFLWGEARYREEEQVEAFAAYKSYALNYPVSNRAPIVEERLYTMGKDYIEGKHETFFGIFSNTGRGEDMLKYIVQTFPNSERADDAQWLLGQYYTQEEDWEKAVPAYDYLVKVYKGSEWYPAARYHSAYSRYRRVKGNYYDQVVVTEARQQFASYVADFPGGEWRADAERIITELDRIAAEKILLIGQWYMSQDKPYSARYYFLRCKALYPDSAAAATAMEHFREVADAVPEGDDAAIIEAEEARVRNAGRESRPASRPESIPDSAPSEKR